MAGGGPMTDRTDQIGQWPRPLAFVLGAGMARAAAQVGMIDSLVERGIRPDLVVGSSWGSVNAAALSMGIDQGVAGLRQFWLDLAADRAWTSRFRGVIRALTPKRSERSADLLREHLTSLLGESKLDDAPVRACCVATDLVGGVAVELSTGRAIDAVMASAAVPLLLPPVVSGDQILADGGIVAPAPLRQAVALGARSVVLLDVGACGMAVDRAQSLRWYEAGIAAYSDLLRSQADAESALIAERVPVVVISIPPGELMNFREADSAMKAGREAGVKLLDALSKGVDAPGLYGVCAADQRGSGPPRLQSLRDIDETASS